MVATKANPSNDTFAAAKVDEAAEQAAAAAAKLHMRKQRKYPGRNLVLSRQDAVDARSDQLFKENADSIRPFECTSPYVVHGIGLPSAHNAIPRYFEGKSNAKVPVEFQSRCRKCHACLMHRRRLWSARASDEIRAANRTWFGTLTVAPAQRFTAQMHAATLAEKAGHGSWPAMSSDFKFKYLVKYLNPEIDKYFKRLRADGADLRYLLVSEAHKDGFPHFHLLIHEQAEAVTKRVLESKWRFGHSHFRLVNDADEKAAFYVCKYLAKDAQTRIRASRHYGRAALIGAATRRLEKAAAALRAGTRQLPPPVGGDPKKGTRNL